MELITIIVIAVGLAMDAFAVSVANGAAYKNLKLSHVLKIALFFGAFQAGMPLLGALAGLSIKNLIANIDHWVAFAILSAIGGKMIYESFKISPARRQANPADIRVLLALSVATSIDALAVGITISLLASSIFLAAAVIGLVTFVLSYSGLYLGKKVGHCFENRIEALAGLVLIAIGAKILIGHLQLT